MAAELEVTFRGMFHLALPPPGNRNHARILMPRNDVPRVAKGNERYTIPAYEAYVAIPTSASPSGREPDLVCMLPVDHPETFDGKVVAMSGKPSIEAVTRAERRERILVEQPKEQYAVFFTSGYEVIVDALRADQYQLQYDSTPIAEDQTPQERQGERSVYWLAPLRFAAGRAQVQSLVMGEPPAAASSYIDLTKGSLRPRGLVPHHHWRYLHVSNDPFLRPVAQELLVIAESEADAVITLRPLAGGPDIVITFTPAEGDRVIIGCEPIDDLLGTSSVQSCVEPAYDFELQYELVGGARAAPPVPLCSNNDVDHRSPPGAACGPPTGGP